MKRQVIKETKQLKKEVARIKEDVRLVMKLAVTSEYREDEDDLKMISREIADFFRNKSEECYEALKRLRMIQCEYSVENDIKVYRHKRS